MGYPANLDAGHKGRFPRSRSEWIVFRSRLRFAAGVCVLAAGLLMGGGGVIAVADPGLGGSAPNSDDGTNAPVQGGPTAGLGNVTDTVRGTIQGVTGTPGSGAQPGQQPATGPTSTLGSGAQPGQQPATGPTSTLGSGAATRPAACHRPDEHTGLGPATRPAAVHRRDKPQERGWWHGHRGPEGRRGPRPRGSQTGRRSFERGGAGY